MRADRLISLILLLQEGGKIPASVLARKLEVSVRTVFRDIDALSGIGVPIYSEQGPKGGFSLLDDYRTDLTGLHAEELLSLFLSSGSRTARYLGLEGAAGAAIRKLASALPDMQRRRVDWYRERILIDSSDRAAPKIATYDPAGSVDLSLLCRAVFESRRIAIRIVWPRPDQAGEYVVSPLGLIESPERWYLAAELNGFVRVYPLEAISSMEVSDDIFERPADFDLEEFWRAWKEGAKRSAGAFVAELAISPSVARRLDGIVREDIRSLVDAAVPDESGRVKVKVTFRYFQEAREFALVSGSAVRVIGPEPLLRSVVSFAEETLTMYGAVK